MKINAQRFNFVEDGGDIAKMRFNYLQTEQNRIKDVLLNACRCEIEGEASKIIYKMRSEFPNLSESEFTKEFTKTQIKIAMILSKLESLVPELRKFTEEFLLNDSTSILNEEEQNFILETYVSPFKELAKEILANFKDSQKLIDSICLYLQVFKGENEIILKLLIDYREASDETSRQGRFFLGSCASSGIRVLQNPLLFAANSLVGTTLIYGLMAYSVVQYTMKFCEKKKKEEVLKINRIEERMRVLPSKEEAQKQLKKIQDLMTKILEDLQKKNDYVKKICSQGENTNFLLVKKFERLMKKELKGTKITDTNRHKLTSLLKDVENNIMQYKAAL